MGVKGNKHQYPYSLDSSLWNSFGTDEDVIRASWVGNLFFYSHVVNEWFSNITGERTYMLTTLGADRVTGNWAERTKLVYCFKCKPCCVHHLPGHLYKTWSKINTNITYFKAKSSIPHYRNNSITYWHCRVLITVFDN